jgi:hypothetical protein
MVYQEASATYGLPVGAGNEPDMKPFMYNRMATDLSTRNIPPLTDYLKVAHVLSSPHKSKIYSSNSGKSGLSGLVEYSGNIKPISNQRILGSDIPARITPRLFGTKYDTSTQ